MNMAFAASHSSKCLKRHVGAVIVDNAGQVVGVGYNENPLGTNPCVLEPSYDYKCHRDRLRNGHFDGLAALGARCPVCGKAIRKVVGPPWRCQECAAEEKKTNLEQYFFPDRAMNWCTAVHAELWAILAAGERARQGRLYTTTFPCFQCAEKLTQVGISQVFYTEPYPDTPSEARLKIAKIDLQRFEGVRSSQFERIFAPLRPR
jgi:deoxycytidylate deaminase